MAELPTAAIVSIAVGCYVAVVIGFIVLCYFLKGRGKCGESHCCAKDEDAQSCECCISMAESCNCCQGPSLTACLNSCCPKKKITCVDILMCQCCASDGTTLCDCCKGPEKETCNCLCLEIRMRSPRDKQTSDMKDIGASPSAKAKLAWSDPTPAFRPAAFLPPAAGHDGLGGAGHHDDLQLDLGWFRSAPYPISTHPINTNRSETSGDFVPTSTPRYHQGQSQLFIHPGVHSAGRVVARRQPAQWQSSRRWSSRRRTSRRSRSPSGRSRSPNRRRSTRVMTNVHPVSRRYSQHVPAPQSPDTFQNDS